MIRRYLPGLIAGLVSLAAIPGAYARPAPPPGDSAQSSSPPSVEPHQRPVLGVSGLEVTHAGPLTVIKIHGMTSTSGWNESTLVPLSRGVPPDGVLDVILVAEPPPEAMAATGFAPVDPVLLVEQNHPYTGVRIGRAPTNGALSFWGGALTRFGQAGVLAAIANSPEAKAHNMAATAQVWSPSITGTLMQELYGTGLGREADPAGNAFWQGALPGLTTSQAASLLVATPEFHSLHGGQDVATFVRSLFETGLGRDPTSGEA